MNTRRVVVADLGLALLLLMAHVACGQNLIKNGDFERFTGDEPVGWETTNIPNFCTVVTPSLKAASGKLAVQLEVKVCSGSKIPGMIIQKRIPIKPGEYEMQFKYLLASVGEDVGFISLEFQNAQGNSIRMCQENISESKVSYTVFKGKFPAPDEAVSAELKIAVIPSKSSGDLHDGTSILVDDMVLIALEPEKEKP